MHVKEVGFGVYTMGAGSVSCDTTPASVSTIMVAAFPSAGPIAEKATS
jgi:hypothetical protein